MKRMMGWVCLAALALNAAAFRKVKENAQQFIFVPEGTLNAVIVIDEVIIKGYCEREGFRRIGFGECRGIITPARSV